MKNPSPLVPRVRAARRASALSMLVRPGAVLRMLFDPKAAWLPKLVVLFTLFYVVMPIDLIPDVIPIFGWLDDMGIVTAALGFIASSAAKHEDDRTSALAT